MIYYLRCSAIVVAVLAAVTRPAASQAVRAEIDSAIAEYLAAHPEQIQAIVKDYLSKNPEVLTQAMTGLIKRRAPNALSAQNVANSAAPDRSSAIRDNADIILNSPHQVVLGNPKGSVTMVEFFDYNCGYCKRALGDMQTLMKDIPDLRVVLKELPILGPGSIEAARVAVAIRMQDPTSEKYYAFHQTLLAARGQVDKSAALAAAAGLGLDMDRLAIDIESKEVNDTLNESSQLARNIGISGTPGYVIGETVISGAIGAAGLKQRLQMLNRASRG